jgi:hypothetical protein
MVAGSLVPLFKNPLAGMENLLNPANWAQDMSWLADVLNPANFKQDFTWLEEFLKTIGGDIGDGMSDIGRGLQGLENFAGAAWKDAEAVAGVAERGAEDIWNYGSYAAMAFAVIYIYSYVK